MNLPEPLHQADVACKSMGCFGAPSHGKMYCDACSTRMQKSLSGIKENDIVKIAVETPGRRGTDTPMSVRYPKYYRPIPTGVTELDVYAICHMFSVNDAALSHALKKIMLPGERTGGKTRRDDIKEARDTLTRWLDLHK